MNKGSLIVFGRFPPPIDGQSLATRRFVSLVEEDYDIVRINTNIAADEPRIRKAMHYLKAGLALRRNAARDPDATIVWQSISGQVSGHFRDVLTVLPAIAGRSVIAVVHWGRFDELFSSTKTRRTAALLARSLDRIVFTTETLSDACSEWLGYAKRSVIANTIDTTTLCTESEVSAKRENRDPDSFRVLFLGNMVREKGYLDVLAAAALLKKERRTVTFDFAGRWYSDADREEFEEVVDRHRLRDIVTHHGPISDRETVKRLHLEADAFVLPSYHVAEAQPVSILETLAAGTPVIASSSGGIADMVQDGKQAFLVPVRSPEAIRDATLKLFDANTWLAMSLRARKLFLEKYHPDAVRSRWIELLTSVGNAPAESD